MKHGPTVTERVVHPIHLAVQVQRIDRLLGDRPERVGPDFLDTAAAFADRLLAAPLFRVHPRICDQANRAMQLGHRNQYFTA